MDFNTVEKFENKLADFFGSPYAVAFDSCTHGIEACLYLTKAKKIIVPKKNLYFNSIFSKNEYFSRVEK